MSEILVELEPPSAIRRLYPRYDSAASTVVVEPRRRLRSKYTMNLDNIVLLNADDACLLVDFDVQYARRMWSSVSHLDLPPVERAADLRFLQRSVSAAFYSHEVNAFASHEKQVALFFWADWQAAKRIELSKRCYALVVRNHLVALLVDLRRG